MYSLYNRSVFLLLSFTPDPVGTLIKIRFRYTSVFFDKTRTSSVSSDHLASVKIRIVSTFCRYV